jgi:hypothetical protein
MDPRGFGYGGKVEILQRIQTLTFNVERETNGNMI